MDINRGHIEVTLDGKQSLVFPHSWWNNNIERRARECLASDKNQTIKNSVNHSSCQLCLQCFSP